MCGSRNYRKENTMEMNIEQFKFCIQNLCRISKDAILIFDNKVFVNSDAEVSNFKDCKSCNLLTKIAKLHLRTLTIPYMSCAREIELS